MGKRKNRTLHAAIDAGLNPYGWGNGGKRKHRKYETPTGPAARESKK